MFAPVVHPDDVRMPQRGGNVGLPDEATTIVVVGTDAGAEDLERFVAGQPWVLGEVDLAHAAGTQQPEDGVSGKYFSGSQPDAGVLMN